MGDDAEYRRLVNKKADAQSRMRSAARKRDNIQDKINRLNDAKRSLSEEYGYFSSVKNKVESDVRHSYVWKGSNYNSFSWYASALVKANKTYYKNIDSARDAINLEIGRLENQLYEQDGIIGGLRSLINSLARRIENFFND